MPNPPHSMSFLSFLFFFFFFFFPFSLSQTPPKGFLIDCGAISESRIEDRTWLPDSGFISAGKPKNLTTPVTVPFLSTVRSFPLQNNLRKKNCYVVNVYRGARYMVRTTYFYGGVNGPQFPSPPVFDQIIDGTLWDIVNTTEDYANGMYSYYEGVFSAQGKTMSLCIASNVYTKSDPFISALEFVLLADSLYNTTDFDNYGLSLVARHSFGYSGPLIRYPDDLFDRFWEPLEGINSTKTSNSNVSVSGFWNRPPLKIFETQLEAYKLEPLQLKWPLASLPNSTYYIALYFARDYGSSLGESMIFNISINNISYYRHLNVTSEGVAVFATQWLLAGLTMITLTPTATSTVGPSVNAGEIFDLRPLGGKTLTRDVAAMERVKESFQNPPMDWNGDPCLPRDYRWTGITCTEGPRIRVLSLNLTSMDLSGSISPYIANMTALTHIWLGNNSISGSIPDMSSLKLLETLHLEDNHLSGEIPLSLGDISSLHEVYLQNNNLTGEVPTNLIGKPGLDLKTSGNNFPSAPTP